VNRPLNLHVEHQDLDGNRRITIFDRGMARLVAHEIDRRWTHPAKARRTHGVTGRSRLCTEATEPAGN
jgi:hypothetical protein